MNQNMFRIYLNFFYQDKLALDCLTAFFYVKPIILVITICTLSYKILSI